MGCLVLIRRARLPGLVKREPGSRRGRAGFSLLEVMVSIAILGLAVTVILSAQGGLAATNKSAANMGSAISLGRCRMTEIEEKMLKLGYPEIDEIDSSNICCDDREVPAFRCEWKVERVILPNPQPSGGTDGGFLSLGGTDEGGVPAMPGAIANNPFGGAGLNLDAGIAGLGQTLTQQVPGGAAGMLSMVFTIVYPSLKPLLETAIRRVTVNIKWREGLKERELVLMQYLSNPSRAGFAAGFDGGVVDAGGGGPAIGAGGTPASGGVPLGPTPKTGLQ